MNPPPAPPVLHLSEVAYGVSGRRLLDGVDLTVSAGQSVSVMGPSGSGKSTLLMCLMGLIRPQSGRVEVAGEDITRLSARKLAAHRRQHIGMIFQFGELLPELTPVENVMIASLLAGDPVDDARNRATSLLTDLGVPEAATTQDLSGGERQRVAVARALINTPELLLADEPTGALDGDQREAVADLLFSTPRNHACALLVVTHDLAVAGRADVQLRLHEGRLVQLMDAR
ncbi:putative ABC transport system ATP-binding protein/lipoprotein-releasing system ATP-binding protein [Streptomyces sp. Ag82_O1-12]|uniref:ABC transporter ATP-binding protein n=1 Tax=unclassified Streptomyces TaxID=2593676 RepID=UPI000BD54F05|nr:MULTISPECIES: ABC transporter ATP-binding protein [unclassified Streptomyces]SMQ17807.1 putative ABC transport system ATP-binding protein/lipoprotein-releasing system ATP-binding protein [Streptomyces sp. Ag82_O1-12]SOD46845.1 putative ABC transport system ATP-binding protein/lipoprotein-releasing system ATP-binding protein [Streptomyces sp. Ag82_G6-1]